MHDINPILITLDAFNAIIDEVNYGKFVAAEKPDQLIEETFKFS